MQSNQGIDNLRHCFAVVNGVRIHYAIGGSGPPMLLVHGWPETWYAWRKVMPDLADSYTVIAPDLRGLGESAKTESGYDKKTLAEDLYGLTRHLNLAKFALVSADMGGPVAFWLAMAHPEAVSHFVYMESGIPGFGLEKLMDVTHGGSWHFGFLMAPEYPEMLLAGKEREFLTAFAYRHSAYVKDAISEADIDEYVRHYANPGGIRAACEYYRALPQDALDNERWRGQKLRMPVLALDGEHGFGGNAATMRELADDVTAAIIPGSGHWIAEEQPQALVEKLHTFLFQK